MKSRFSSHWWLTFLVLNFIPVTSKAGLSIDSAPTPSPAAADASPKILVKSAPPVEASKIEPDASGYAYLDMAHMKNLVAGFGLKDSVDESGNLVFTGTVPNVCRSWLVTDFDLDGKMLVISFKDKKGKFQDCVRDCRRGEVPANQCTSIAFSAQIPGESTEALKIGISLSNSAIETTPWDIRSQKDLEIEALADLAVNCRGNEEYSLEHNLAQLAAAESAVKKLEQAKFFDDNEELHKDLLEEIKSARTDFEQKKVADFEMELEGIAMGPQLEGNKDLNRSLDKLRKKVLAFAKAHKGEVSDDVSALLMKIAETDLNYNGNDMSDFASYTKAQKRALKDYKAATKLKGLSQDEKIAQANFGVGLSMHRAEYLAQQGSAGAFGYFAASNDTRQMLDYTYARSGCHIANSRISFRGRAMAGNSMNTRCSYLDTSRKRLAQVDKFQRQQVDYEAKYAQYQEQKSIYDQIAEDQARQRQEIEELSKQGVELALANAANRRPNQFPNGQIVGPNGQVIPNNGQVNPNLPGSFAQNPAMMAPREPMAPRGLPPSSPFPNTATPLTGPTGFRNISS